VVVVPEDDVAVGVGSVVVSLAVECVLDCFVVLTLLVLFTLLALLAW
jgi:hypothetical protein